MLHIVLIEPEIPQNTGNIARSCAVTGAQLHLVHPLGFAIDDKKLKRAGLDYWDKLNVSLHDSFDEISAKTDRFFLCTTKAQKTHTQVRFSDEDYLVFGKETAGIPKNILDAHLQKQIRIPMKNDIRSLNLSNASAIVLYEALRQLNFPNMH